MVWYLLLTNSLPNVYILDNLFNIDQIREIVERYATEENAEERAENILENYKNTD